MLVGRIAPQELKAEASNMFAMLAALTADQRSAEITSGTFDDLLMGPGKDSGDFPTPEGLLVSGLNDDQRKVVTAALQTYVGDLSTGAATKLTALRISRAAETSASTTRMLTPVRAG